MVNMISSLIKVFISSLNASLSGERPGPEVFFDLVDI